MWRGHIKLETLDGDPTARTYIPVYSETPATELAILGVVSLSLTLMNIVVIFVIGILILKVSYIFSIYLHTKKKGKLKLEDLPIYK